jgi:hypothetical protein
MPYKLRQGKIAVVPAAVAQDGARIFVMLSMCQRCLFCHTMLTRRWDCLPALFTIYGGCLLKLVDRRLFCLRPGLFEEFVCVHDHALHQFVEVSLFGWRALFLSKNWCPCLRQGEGVFAFLGNAAKVLVAC